METEGSVDRIILHVDMNSYFASVEQQARPQLLGRPIGVTGSDKKRTIIVAASIEAKKFSVKTGTQVHEAKKLCPHIVLIVADCNRYEAITRQFLKIFVSKTPLVEIFSIDEAFLDLSSQADSSQQAEVIAIEIKQKIKETIGQNIRCSIGIAQNKFMAKLASEAHKPDGLTVVAPGKEIKFLDQFKLTDACGIGSRIYARLVKLGVNSFRDLRSLDQTTLTLIFNSYGLKLWSIARGIDRSPILPYFLRPEPKSISRSKTLSRNTLDKSIIEKFVLSFCHNIGAELRQKKLLAGSVGIYLRLSDFTHIGRDETIRNPTDLTSELFSCAKQILNFLEVRKPVRKIGVWVGALTRNQGQIYLLTEFERREVVEQTADQINKKYGGFIVKSASLASCSFDGRSPNFGFQKDFTV